MKKFIRAAVVLGMILCLAVTALAAPGETDDPSKACNCEIDMGSVTGPNGEHVDLVISDVSEQVIPVEYGGEVDFGDGDVVDAEDLTVAYLKDLTSEVLPVTITFEVDGTSDGDVLHVMHFNGTKWEQIAEGTGDSITATFTSLSPVAVVVEHPHSAENPPAPGGTTSPVTGEEPALLIVAAAVALLAGTVAVVTLKKKEM